MPFLFVLLGLIVLFLLMLLLRAVRFRPQPQPEVPPVEIPIDPDAAVAHLREMVRCKTVSAKDQRDEATFIRFRTMLPQLYPAVFAACESERIGPTGLVLRWKGRTAERPAVFLSHYDVVPADERFWEKPPFEGILEDGVLWGRGTLDMKNQLCGVLEAMEYLISQSFTPRHDIYFCLSGEEEVMGPTAEIIRDTFRNRGISPAFVVDEGGDVMDGFFPHADVTAALIGIGEKGAANLHFTARGPGGHASTPPADNPLPRLCRTMTRIEQAGFPQKNDPALDRLTDALGRHCPLKTRLLLANRDILRPLYFRWLRRQGGMLLASSKTTFALTMASGSDAGNVVPAQAEMFANLRLLWGDTVDETIQKLQTIANLEQVEIRKAACAEPRPASLCTDGWAELQSAIRQTWPEAVVAPYLMVASTDSRHWRDICDNVYRFSAKSVTRAEKSTVHGNNERIRVENTLHAAQFFARLMLQW